MSVEINEEFAAALRELLIEHVQADGSRRRLLRWPRTAALRVLLAGGVIAAGGGAAAATGLFSMPGSTATTQLATAITVTGSGTQTISLGPRPQGANAISLTFMCLTPGRFIFADGSSEQCSTADTPRIATATATATFPLAVGQNTTVITAALGERWRATVFYASTDQIQYGTNASGQTYGADGGQGGSPLHEPDLVAVQATNGRLGYAYATQLNGPTPTSPTQAVAENNRPARMIPVYESDGKTQIGQFKVGN